MHPRLPGKSSKGFETLEKCQFLFKFKEDEKFNRRRPAGSALGVNIWNISRIKF